MKYSILAVTLISSLFLTSCSINSSKDTLFEKKKYCAELKIEWVTESKIFQRFYSPKIDSCIYYQREWGSDKIYNALTKEFIIWTFTEWWDIESWKIFEWKLKELKWE